MSDPPHIDPEAGDKAPPSIAPASLDRFSSFLLVFGAITLFLSVYLISVELVERNLQLHFEEVVAEAIQVEVSPRNPGATIRNNLVDRVDLSDWVQIWGVRVDVSVLARDDQTWLYVNGRIPALRYPARDRESLTTTHANLLPATALVEASIGYNTMLSNSILFVASVLLFEGLFLFNRHVARLQDKALDQARESRDRAASEAHRIEDEIDMIREQLRVVEPANQEHREEIVRLQSQQRELQGKLGALAARERELRRQAERARALEEDGLALEELLEEATHDLGDRNEKIRELEKTLKREGRSGGAAGRSKDAESLSRRMRFLYPNVEVDARAIDDLIDVRDELAMLRVEECIKRLNDDAENLPIRRKVTGLPSHLSIYEMGFAGKRRLYFARVSNGHFRVLVVGAKNTQQSNLDYLARIPKGELTS